MKTISKEEFENKISGLRTLDDAHEFVKELVAPILQEMLNKEIEEHLGYAKYDRKGQNSGNSRNGHSLKKLKGRFGESELKIPRDRNGEFEPVVVRKYQTVDNGIEEKIISMYAKGMTTRDINAHIQDIYGVDISSAMVSAITDKILPLIEEWQDRPLAELYVIMYLDGIHFNVKDNGRIITKCCYTVMGINEEGNKDLLGLWISENEGAKFWMNVLNELKHRGVKDIIICCIDGLKGFSEGIAAVFPKALIQRCIVHQVRATTKYIPWKDRKAFCQDLKKIYTAPTEESGFKALQAMKEAWPKYRLHLERWERDWKELSTFYGYSAELRRLMYTTNPVESLHRQMRKVTKTTSIFPHDESLKKLLWLAHRDIAKKWTLPVRDWRTIISQLAIEFPDRIKL